MYFFAAADQEFVDELVDIVGQVLVLRVWIGRLHVAATRPAQRLGFDGDGGQREPCRDAGEQCRRGSAKQARAKSRRQRRVEQKAVAQKR